LRQAAVSLNRVALLEDGRDPVSLEGSKATLRRPLELDEADDLWVEAVFFEASYYVAESLAMGEASNERAQRCLKDLRPRCVDVWDRLSKLFQVEAPDFSPVQPVLG